MKKKISIILLLFTIFLSSITYVDEVWGDNNAGLGSNNSIGACKDGSNCYKGAVGFRITIVDENGNRFKYNGKESLSIDYWYNKNDIEGLTDKNCFAYSTKRTKKEFTSNLSKEGIVNCRTITDQGYEGPYANLYDIKDIGFPDPNDNFGESEYLNSWETSGTNSAPIKKTRTAINIDKIIDLLSCSQVVESTDVFYKFGQDKTPENQLVCINQNGQVINSKTTNNKYLNKIFQNAYDDSSIDLSKSGTKFKGAYVQFEQLLQVENYKMSAIYSGKSVDSNFIVTGTVAEVSYIYDKYMDKQPARICVLNPTNTTQTGIWSRYGDVPAAIGDYGIGAKWPNLSNCTNSMPLGGYWSGWYGKDSKGIGSDLFILNDDNNKHIVDINSYRLGTTGLVNSDFKMSLFYQRDTSNVFSFWVNPKIAEDSSCHGQASEIIQPIIDKGNVTLTADGYYLNKNGFSDIEAKLCDSSNEKTKAIRDYGCCDGNKINVNKCPRLSKEYLTKVGAISNGDYCSTLSCSNDVELRANDKFTYTDPVYKRVIGYFNGYFNKEEDAPTEPGLSYEIWHDFFGTKAKCGVEIPDCSPQKLETSCATTPSFTLKDSGELEKCIKFGFAYNDGPTGSLEASKDDEYSFEGKPGYCYEEVSFNFPQGGKTVTAGTVLKWRISNLSSIDNLFGTMTVYRKCFIPDGLENGHVITSNWANVSGTEQFAIANGRINPKVYLQYQQPITGSTEISSQLSVYLHKFESYAVKDNGKFFEDFNFVVYDENGRAQAGIYTGSRYRDDINISEEIERIENDGYYNGLDGNNPRQFTCPKDECNDINYVEMQATYNIVYNDNLKWYSDKNLNGELITIGDEGVQSSYAFAGYGLPTSFPIADNVYCEGYGFNKKNNNAVGAYGKGKLDVIVKQVGTLGPNGYHFNKLISDSDLFIDDNKSSNENIDYYCNYKVNNPLFDTEYSSEGGAMCDPSRTPKGIDVVFRTVKLISSKDELNKAFPGRSGLGHIEGEVGTRTMGANWYKFSDESIADLLGDNVYNQEPMYEITLDSPTIQTIREWNRAARSQDIDPYTYMGESEASDASDASYGFTGYEYYTITKNFDGEDHEYSFVASKFLEALDTNFEHFNTNCIISVSDTFTRRENCNQSWWKEGLDKHTISMELRTPIGG